MYSAGGAARSPSTEPRLFWTTSEDSRERFNTCSTRRTRSVKSPTSTRRATGFFFVGHDLGSPVALEGGTERNRVRARRRVRCGQAEARPTGARDAGDARVGSVDGGRASQRDAEQRQRIGFLGRARHRALVVRARREVPRHGR